MATAAFACIAPPTTREAISIPTPVARPVAKKLIARPQKPSKRSGLRPKRSDSPPRTGDAKKLAIANANTMTPYQVACSLAFAVNWPTIDGSTGSMIPIDSMSIRTTSMMKPIAASRPAGLIAEPSVIGCRYSTR